VEVTWVVVADGSRARFFELTTDRRKHRTLQEFDAMVAPEHRLREADLTSDRAGRTFDSKGRGRHALEPPHKARDQATDAFARRLAEHVEDARIAGYIDKLVLIAAPRFLGQLRSRLSEKALALVVHSIDKELTTATCDEVAGYLPRFFPSATIED
jgi:protein required for attachment to host cells